MNTAGGSDDSPPLPPRTICIDYEGSELFQCARALSSLVFPQECDRLPESTIEFVCTISVASVLAREMHTGAKSESGSEDANVLVIKMLEDPAIMVPEVRRILDVLNQLWGENCVTATLTEEHCLDIMFGKQGMKSSGEGNDDDSRDGGSLTNGLTSGVVGGNDIGLIILQDGSTTSSCATVHIDRVTSLSPKVWQQRRRVRGSISSDVLIAQHLGCWVVAFPTITPLSELAVRRRCIVIPVTLQRTDDKMQDSGVLTALRELFLKMHDSSVSDEVNGNEDCGERDPVGFADGVTVEQLLNALVIGFALASMVKVGLFLVNCDIPYNEHSECSRFDEEYTCGDSSRESSRLSRQLLYDMGTCFVFGPEN